MLRDYQKSAIDDLRAAYRDGSRAPLLVLPTGGGKTYVFCEIARSARERGNVLILVHRAELLAQSSASLRALGVPHACIAPRHAWDPTERVQVASVQALVRRFARMDADGWAPSLIIVDEAHHATAGTWRKILAQWPAARVLGVTATPCRSDGAGLGDVFDALVEGPQIDELIGLGHLVPPVVYAPPGAPDLTGVRRRGGDYDATALAQAVDTAAFTGSAVAHYARLVAGAPAVAFCANVAHARHVAEEFRSAGWRAESLDGTMADSDRKRLIDQLGRGDLNVLTSCDIVSEGTDIPVIAAAILLRPTQSTGLYLQQVGRALRTSPGKDRAVIIDHVNNSGRHGMPDDRREWSLDGDGAAQIARAPAPKTCLACYMQYMPPTRAECPYCAAARPPATVPLSALRPAPADLVVRVSASMQTRKQRQANALTLADLEALGREWGYRSPRQWAMKVFGARAVRSRENR